jgi:predicted Zn-dependent peptidase
LNIELVRVAPRLIVTDQKIHTHQLRNGLVLIAEEMDWLESAAFALLVPAGAALENVAQAGLGHLTCEMVERGAGERDSRGIIADLENLGADCSSSCANTHTSFGGAMPAESLEAVLSIYADVVQRPHLPEDQLEDARLGCLQDVRALEDDLSQKLFLELRQRFYADPHGRSALGTVESLTGLTQKDVQRFFQTVYRPQGAILSVAGKIDWPRVGGHVEKVFGGWQPGVPPTTPETPPPRGYQHLPVDSSQTHIGIGYEGLAYADPDYFQLRGAIGVLADGMSSRLFTEVREKRGLAYTVFAMCHSLKDRGGVFAYAGTTAERAQETLDVLSAELRKLPQGIAAEELGRLKGKIKRSLVLQQESSPSRSGSMAFDWYFLGRVRPMAELSKIIDDLSVESINNWLKKHPPGEFTVVTLGPKPLELPA